MGELIDFMPTTGDSPTNEHRLVRMLRCVRGTITFAIEVAPRFDYGRRAHRLTVSEDGALFDAGDTRLTLSLIREEGDARLGRNEATDDGDLRVSLSLEQGQMRGVVLETGPDRVPHVVRPAEAQRLIDDTAHFWQDWVSQSTYTGRWREELQRSAITLKLLTYAPTGGLVAAPTAGLPEQIGGERNWDYRYTWVRDASFSVHTLARMGFVEEAVAFSQWLRDRVIEQAGSDTGPLNIMYRVDGDPDLEEETLADWEGYRGSHPVRIGNGAAGQLQLDIYGEALDAVYYLDTIGVKIGQRGWLAMCELLDWLADNWDQPEEGIWETRGGRKDFTYGRLMCWVAFDRGIRLATAHGRPAAVARWTAERDAIYNQIMDKGWSAEREAFVQQYGENVLDASLLKMSQVGFVAPSDPHVAVDAARDGHGAGLRQPGVPVRPERIARRASRLGGHVLALHLPLRGCARSRRPARRRTAHLREDADLREPPRPVLRGDRPHRRTDRQLPAGIHPSRAHRCRNHLERPAGRGGRQGAPVNGQRPIVSPVLATNLIWIVAVAVDLAIRVAAIIIIPRDRKPSAAMAWLLAVFLIPFVGVFFFLLLGSSKLPKKRREKQATINTLIADGKRRPAHRRRRSQLAAVAGSGCRAEPGIGSGPDRGRQHRAPDRRL